MCPRRPNLSFKFISLVSLAFAAGSSALLNTPAAKADLGEVFGFGSRAGGLAGGSVAGAFDGFATYSNPAGLTALSRRNKRFVFSGGLTYNMPRFDAIDNVIIENDYTSDEPGPIRGNVEVDNYRETFGMVFGAGGVLAPQLWNLSVGAVGFVPVKQLAYMDTGRTFQPEYVLHRSRTQRPQFAAAVAVEPVRHLSFGAGLLSAFTLTSNADVFVQTDAPKPSSMRFAATLKPKLLPYFGVLYTSPLNQEDVTGENTGPATKGLGAKKGAFGLGFVTRVGGSSENEMVLDTSARVLNPLPALPFRFQAESAIYYDPLTLQWGAFWQYTAATRVYASVDYQFWGDFEAPALLITPSPGVNITAGGTPPFAVRNILVPRVAHEWAITPRVILRAGYSFRPSIFDGAPNGASNYLDPSRDIFTLGAGVWIDKLLGQPYPWRLDIHGAYHSMRGIDVSKQPGDERGLGTGARKVGAPGYKADGYVYGAGISMTVEI
jgi:hypothetical protein